jgi:hypothetical protein
MATAKEIFDGLQQYPLPAKSGVKDYVFYFVPNNDDGYGARAHDFFKKFYSTYAANDVVSIEQMIGILFKDVSGSVKQIRELVIVAHGTPQGLIIPVVSAARLRRGRVLDVQVAALRGRRSSARRFLGDDSRLPGGAVGSLHVRLLLLLRRPRECVRAEAISSVRVHGDRTGWSRPRSSANA